MQYPDGFLPQYRNRGICGVLAVSIAANVHYDVAKAALKRAMHDLGLGQRFRGATNNEQRKLAMKRLAVKFSDVDIKPNVWSVRDWLACHAEPGQLYMLRVKGHVFMAKDGNIIDQGYFGPVNQWRSGKRKLFGVIRIDGKGW